MAADSVQRELKSILQQSPYRYDVGVGCYIALKSQVPLREDPTAHCVLLCGKLCKYMSGSVFTASTTIISSYG